jgi:hypothetical protein
MPRHTCPEDAQRCSIRRWDSVTRSISRGAGLRLPGEALGLRWGAVDFQMGVMRPYDNWVRNEMDTTKTSDSEAIPMTPG